jgi:hypothetical protein
MCNYKYLDKDRKKSIVMVNEDVAAFANIINRFRELQANKVREVDHKELGLNDKDKEVLRIVLMRLRLTTNQDVQEIFNLQAGRTSKGYKASDVKRISLTSGDVLRMLKPRVEKTLRYDRRTREWRFRRLDCIETNSIKRKLTEEEVNFFEDEQNRLIVLRDIVEFDGEDARMWLNPQRVITRTKEIGEKVIKEIKEIEAKRVNREIKETKVIKETKETKDRKDHKETAQSQILQH